MADDMGYEALSVNGSESCKSPNLDKLAAQGVRFTNRFANPICTPSRAKIMTGQYNVRNYIKFGLLDRGQTTFAHQLKAAGYATCIAGKWQLGKQVDSPQHFGFEQSCLWQHTRSGRSNEKGKKFDRRFVNPLLEFNGKEKDYVNGEYGPQVCTDFVCDFIDRNKEEPFFIYYPMKLTHGPFVPTPDSADRSSTANQQNFEDMVAYMDKLVGRVVDKLDEAGVRNNTLILFTGDNGSPGGKKGGIKSELNGRTIHGGKSLTTDAGTRVALVANMPGTVPPGKVTDDLVDFSDMMPTIAGMTRAEVPAGEVLDGVSFAPQLRGGKGTPREWIYLYYEPVPGPEPNPTIFARDQRWKLYSDGRLFDISKDVLEMNPIMDGGGQAREKLQAVLDSMPSEGMKIYRPKFDALQTG